MLILTLMSVFFTTDTTSVNIGYDGLVAKLSQNSTTKYSLNDFDIFSPTTKYSASQTLSFGKTFSFGFSSDKFSIGAKKASVLLMLLDQ